MGVFMRGKAWYVKFRVNGKPIVKSAGECTKAQAKAYETELRKQHAKRPTGSAGGTLFANILAEHILAGDGYDTTGTRLIKRPREAFAIKASSWERYRCSLGQIKGVLATFKETKHTVSDIDDDWLRDYIKRRKAASRVSNRTLRRDLDALSNIFS